MIARQLQRSILAPVQSGYALDDVWSVILPVARTNIITNPSFETATTSWAAIGGSIARSTTYQYHGAYSLAITPTAATTDGVRFDSVSLTNGTTYAYSAKVRGQPGVSYKLSIETTGAVELTSVVFTATGKWQWIYGYWTEISSTTRRLTLRKNGSADTHVFYLDGAQVEATGSEGVFVTTYIDGDQVGLVPNQQPPAYLWNGTPHASTSIRSGLTRAGGRVMPLSRYGFLLTAMIGLGLAAPNNIATPFAQLDGASYARTQKPPRQFTLTGRFEATDYPMLKDQRGDLMAVVDRDAASLDQPLVLTYQSMDSCENAIGDECRIIANYAGGLGGNTDNLFAEQVPITFTMYLPNILSSGEQGSALAVQQSVANANVILQRTPGGQWQAMGTGCTGGSVNVLAQGLNANIYAGGTFTAASGVANTTGIARWDGAAWNAMGTGAAGGDVFSLAVAPNGNIYAGGTFTSMGGVANTARIARWDGAAWNALGTGAPNGSVKGLAVAANGDLYAVGSFTGMGGVGSTNRIARWDGSAWNTVGNGVGAGASLNAITIGIDGKVYVGGTTVTTIGGVSVSVLAVWNGTIWAAMGGATNSDVLALATGLNGDIYAGGEFTQIGAIAANYAARWNGVIWSPLGGGLSSYVFTIEVLPDGSLYFGGAFATAGGITLADSFVRWNGAVWTMPDVDFSGATTTTNAILLTRDGGLVVGFNSSASATAAGLTTITNTGTARTYPRLIIRGPSSSTARVHELTNMTTGRAIYFNYTINAGETATLDFDPLNLSFTSDFQGNIVNKILPGSNEADFFLAPGTNSISLFIPDTTVTATISWRPAYTDLDSALIAQ